MIAAFQIDPLNTLNYHLDTSVLLMEEFQSRGYKIFCYTPSSLAIKSAAPIEVIAEGDFINLTYNPESFYTITKTTAFNLNEATILFIRQNPPFNSQYLTTTYILEKLAIPVVNSPIAIRNHVEKLIPFDLSEFQPPTIITKSQVMALDFLQTHKDVVIKPLYGYGGKGVKRATNKAELADIVNSNNDEALVIQPFLPNIKNGDKRIYIVCGEPIMQFRKMPAKTATSFVTNIAFGGYAVQSEESDDDRKIIAAASKWLKANNIAIAGLDVLDQYLFEINITSPTGLKAAETLYNINYRAKVVDLIMDHFL